jgi:hypothetical protein
MHGFGQSDGEHSRQRDDIESRLDVGTLSSS